MGGVIFALLVVLDALMYGYIYEHMILNRDYGLGIFRWSGWRFVWWVKWDWWEWLFEGSFGKVPRYRILQKVIEISGLAAVWYFGSWVQVIGILWAFYFMANELGYYVLLGQMWLPRENYIGKEVPWMRNWFQSGCWLFQKEYSYLKFLVSAFIGVIGIIVSEIISIII